MNERARRSIPWRRLWGFIRPLRSAVAGMLALTLLGSLAGLIPPLAVGTLVNALVSGGGEAEVAGWLALIVGAAIVEAGCLVGADGLYAAVGARLYRELRLRMFEGLARLPHLAQELAIGGIASRFVSDAEELEDLTVSALHFGLTGAFELVAALVALLAIDPLAGAVTLPLLAATALVFRRTQAPVAQAGEDRQEALEEMSGRLNEALSERMQQHARASSFRVAADRVLAKDVRLGWLEAGNRHGAAALTRLAPLAVVIVAAARGGFKAGTLLSLFLLTERAFTGAEELAEVKLDVEVVRGAVSRCFELIDGKLTHGSTGVATPSLSGDVGRAP